MKIIKKALLENRIKEKKFLQRYVGKRNGISHFIYDIPNPNYIYYEKHHILPKSLFPNWIKKDSNLVLLTAREHFFCHQLLTKIYPKKEMFFAVKQMMIIKNENRNYKFSSRDYQKNKEKIKEYQKLSMSGSNSPMYGKTLSQETKLKISESTKKTMSTMHDELSRKQKAFQAANPEWNSNNRKKFLATEKGKKFIENMKKNLKGRKRWTNGIKTIMQRNCPEGWEPAGNANKLVSQSLWYNNGIENKRIVNGDPIPEGFKLGRYKKNQKWYTDGIHSKLFLPNEKIPENWMPGKTYTEPEGLIRKAWNKGKRTKLIN
jgi:hypothetical protein